MRTPLFLAQGNGNRSCISALIAGGAKARRHGGAPLWTHLWALFLVGLTLFIIAQDPQTTDRPATKKQMSMASQPPSSASGTERMVVPQLPSPDMIGKTPVVTPLQYPVASQVTILPTYLTSTHRLAAVNGLTLAPDGSVWVATEHGVAIIRGDDVTVVSGDSGAFPAEQASCITHDGVNVWIGSVRGLFCTTDGRTFRTFTAQNGLAHTMVWSLHWDGHLLWIGTQHGFSFMIPDSVFYSVTKLISNGGLAADWIGAIKKIDRFILVGTDEGLSVWDTGIIAANPSAWRTLDFFTGPLPHQWVSALALHHGVIWVGTPQGTARLQPTPGTLFAADGGHPVLLPSPAELQGVRINSLCSHRQHLWIGTNQGLYRWDEEHLVVYGISDGLLADDIRALVAADHTLWLGTAYGVQSLRLDALP